MIKASCNRFLQGIGKKAKQLFKSYPKLEEGKIHPDCFTLAVFP
jgi:hypothetical protein